jgi:hypothetical protein
VEAGYHGRFTAGGSNVRLFAEGFAEEVEDLINIVNRIVPAGSVSDRPTVTILQQFQNSESREGWGFETGGEWSRSGIGLVAQYAYQKFRDATTNAPILRDTPRHKVSAALRLQKGPLDAMIWGHRVTRTTADTGYFLLNPRLAVHARDWQLAVNGFNVLDDKHIETVNNAGVLGQVVGRTVTFNLSYGWSLGRH